ncbi:uncharacterized protein LOC107675539 [Sinocyclocheilus anshuiensis]|uniref:uncharacterized protein LOC107675539 n=1 Tax=Sinocyclocheilus anshuiensis TaxID=1608454 RepID=UPI0007B99B59|nr:PREDICTED: uncharacterized protein LOC107675539 [Sinocyclocheilus anshuiensis]
MDTSFCYPSFQPDTESIMSVMHELKEKNLTDNTLLSNLDFAERFFRDHPLKPYSKLLVKGNYSCVQIGQNDMQVFNVTSENNQTYISVFVHDPFDEEIKKSFIEARHFFNHSCQDEIKSCFTQAQEAVTKEDLTRLHIKCNRFSVTYATRFSGPCTTVETKCQLKLENLTAEGLLNKKVWLQKEKPTCPGLIACLDHLIKQYLTTIICRWYSYRFVIHADKEMIRITSCNEKEKEYVLIHDHEGVSMFPPTLQ